MIVPVATLHSPNKALVDNQGWPCAIGVTAGALISCLLIAGCAARVRTTHADGTVYEIRVPMGNSAQLTPAGLTWDMSPRMAGVMTHGIDTAARVGGERLLSRVADGATTAVAQ